MKNPSPNDSEPGWNDEREYAVFLQVDPAFADVVDSSLVVEVVRQTLLSEGVSGPAELTVVITDDEQIGELNKAFLGKDEPTDVISFLMKHKNEIDGFVTPPEIAPYLGDVVVSYPRAAEQGPAFGHSPEEELNFLVAHGVLHLLDYDDATEEGRRDMLAKQEAILASVKSGV